MNRLPALAVLRDEPHHKKTCVFSVSSQSLHKPVCLLMALNVGHINLKGFTFT